MSFGLLSTGFVLKRLEDIKSELEADLKGSFGEITTSPDSVFGQIIGLLSRSYADIWELAESVYYSMYPASGKGFSLDGILELSGLTRLAATKSTVVCQLEGTSGTVIPIGNQLSQSSSGKIFENTADVTIVESNLHRIEVWVSVAAYASYTFTISGYAFSHVPASEATKSEICDSIIAAVNLNVGINSLVEAVQGSTDEMFELRIKNSLDSESNEIPLLISRFFEYVDTDAKLVTNKIWSPAKYIALNLGANPVPTNSIDTIENPVSGLASVSNMEEGITGRPIESDTAARLRRKESLLSGNATLESIKAKLLNDVNNITNVSFVENDLDTWVGSRPPHSIEMIVQGGSDEEIAQKIWETKAGGIQTYGNTSAIIQDSNGNNQLIEFSRPVTKYMYIRVDYDTTDSEGVFPDDGETQLRDKLYESGLNYGIGEDVLYQKFYSAVYSIPGISTAEIYIATDSISVDPNPSWVQDNIVVAANENPSFANNVIRIVINDVTP